MAEYNVVSYCRSCKKRMVHKKGEYQGWYCPACQERLDKARAREAADSDE
ncbi:hypothetical protein JXA12_00320 [Candidatus Woesearchaeota archaeon]|nr:hypothetical protein [Candidatus Woesearchaeota archaeon]